MEFILKRKCALLICEGGILKGTRIDAFTFFAVNVNHSPHVPHMTRKIIGYVCNTLVSLFLRGILMKQMDLL